MTTPTLNHHIQRYVEERHSLGRLNTETAMRVGYRLRRFSDHFGRRPLSQLTVRHVEQWLVSIRHLSPGTRRLNLSNVSCLCQWLVDQGALGKDPTRGLSIAKPRAVPRALSLDRAVALVSHVEQLDDPRARVIVALMLYCGLRCCEVSWADVDDYDDRARTLLVRGKGGHERVLPVPAPAAAILDIYLIGRGIVSGPLFQSQNSPGVALTPGSISRLVAGWMVDAGVKRARYDGRSAHALRHTCASDVLEACNDVRIVQKLLGHASVATTEIYLRRVGLSKLRAAVEGRSYDRAA
jgi:integrase/recombinase XerD